MKSLLSSKTKKAHHSYMMDSHFDLIPSDANPTPLIVAPSLVRERGVVVVYIYLHTCIYPTPFLSSFFANEIMKLNVMDEGRTDTDSVTESIQVISFCDTGGGGCRFVQVLTPTYQCGKQFGLPSPLRPMLQARTCPGPAAAPGSSHQRSPHGCDLRRGPLSP